LETKEGRKIKIAIIGFGLIGKERLSAIKTLKSAGRDIEITGIYDPYINHEVTDNYPGIVFFTDLSALYSTNPDWVIISVPHDTAIPIVQECLLKNFNVLIEKPLGRNSEEARQIKKCEKRDNQLWVGFNYRFYEGVKRALKDIEQGTFGQLVSLNMELGHGNSPQMNSWKLSPSKVGGGCLIDPGIHFIDLCRIISKDRLKIKTGMTWNGFWNTGIEEECHIIFDGGGFIINLNLSIVRWKSTFKIEINGHDGYGIIHGRNRSYGIQKYKTGKRWEWTKTTSQEESEKFIVETDGKDTFVKELDALLFPDILNDIRPCSGTEAVKNMEILDECRKILGLGTLF